MSLLEEARKQLFERATRHDTKNIRELESILNLMLDYLIEEAESTKASCEHPWNSIRKTDIKISNYGKNVQAYCELCDNLLYVAHLA
jgi:hypothetical protein